MSDILDVLKRNKLDLEQALPVDAATLHLDEIEDRPGGDTRPLNPAHVEELAKSIALLGLIEPLVVDNQNRLLAGGHRRAAILQLWADEPETFEKYFPNGVPVHRLDIDAEKDPELALEIEISENERRRDYSRSEIKALAERLKEAGYTDSTGRPKKGEKRLRPALELIVGKSIRQLRRYINEDTKKSGTDVPLSDKENTNQRLLTQAHKALSKWLEQPHSKKEKGIEGTVTASIEAIENLL